MRVFCVLGSAVLLTAASLTIAVPAQADQQTVNPARCAAQGGTYSTSGTSRSCTVATTSAPENAFQFLDAPVTGTQTAAAFQIVHVTDTTTTTTGNQTTTTSTTGNPEIVPGSASCSTGSVPDILSGVATPMSCAGLGIPDLNASQDPIFIEA